MVAEPIGRIILSNQAPRNIQVVSVEMFILNTKIEEILKIYVSNHERGGRVLT